jgi:hypothetical protein
LRVYVSNYERCEANLLNKTAEFVRMATSDLEPRDVAFCQSFEFEMRVYKIGHQDAFSRAFTPNSLSQAIRRVVLSIPEMPDNRSIHGLRYAAAARLNEAGCTVTQSIAVLGHRTHGMAVKYMSQREASLAAVTMQEQSA